MYKNPGDAVLPLTLCSDTVVYFDVDETLVLWNYPPDTDPSELVEITGPEFTVTVKPHKTHIEHLKRYRARGQGVVVWSAGGYSWAKEVVTKLGLESCVDLILCKPKWYYDDLQADDILGDRVYYKL